MSPDEDEDILEVVFRQLATMDTLRGLFDIKEEGE